MERAVAARPTIDGDTAAALSDGERGPRSGVTVGVTLA
jgi:hypothetical protein